MRFHLSSSRGGRHAITPSCSYLLVIFVLLFTGFPRSFAAEPPRPSQRPCTLKSPLTGAFFDFNWISLTTEESKGSSSRSSRGNPTDSKQSWISRGYDYGTNFTLNVCAPVLENVHDVVGINRGKWDKVGAFYVKDNKTYSIG